jgi:large subunit ribosomal protein L2
MAILKAKPTSPGRRGVISIKSDLYKGRPLKSLTESKNKKGGRNNNGRITVRHQGGGHKKNYRIIDFKRNKFDIPAVIERIEYDPNRSAHIALLKYKDGEKSYIIAPSKVKVGDEVISSENCEIKVGNSMKLKDIPLGTNVHCVELKPMKGAQIARSAGTSARLIAK